jgi:hypothetical protein
MPEQEISREQILAFIESCEAMSKVLVKMAESVAAAMVAWANQPEVKAAMEHVAAEQRRRDRIADISARVRRGELG